MQKIIFASHNKNKVLEVKSLMPSYIQLLSLKDLGYVNEILETETTIEGNALIKAKTIFFKTKINCFADDSGLLIDALHGAPGVLSARYAGEQKNDNDNIDKVLKELKNCANRNSQFKTVLALLIDGKEFMFEGKVKGKITTTKMGSNGFGYDSIFIPNGYTKTFAEMDINEKSSLSHRAIAMNKMIEFLKNNY